MLRLIKKLLGSPLKNSARSSNFFDMSAEQQKKIIKKAVRKANADQLEIVESYSDKSTRLELEKCSR